MNTPKPLPTREVEGGMPAFAFVFTAVLLCTLWGYAVGNACSRPESTTESTTDNSTETDDTSTGGMTPIQTLLFMRLIKALP